MADTPNSGASSAPSDNGSTTSSQSQEQSSAPIQAVANDAAAVIADPSASKAQKVQAAKTLKSLRIKVDGQEYEERLPFEVPDTKEARDYLTRQLQMGRAGTKRMNEKAQLENEVRSFLEQLKSNPRKVLSDPTFGVDLKKLAAEMIEQEIANAAKSPEQLRAEKLEQELQDLKDKSKKDKDEFDAREQERLTESEFERYDTLMSQAIEKSDLPKSPYVVKKMADLMMIGLREGLDVSPEDIMPLVRQEILEDIQQMAQAMPLETIEKLFGGDILTKLRKKNVARAKTAPSTGSPKLPDVGATPAAKTEKDDKTPKKTIKQLWGV